MSTPNLNFICKDVKARQEAVANTYERIVNHVKNVLRTLENEQMRTHIQLEYIDDFAHQFLSPIMFLRLSSGLETISFAIDLELQNYLGTKAYTQLVRTVYRETMHEWPDPNIEDCLEQFEYWYTDYEEAEQHPNAKITIEDFN